jgi:cell division transport system ATP-binding protein
MKKTYPNGVIAINGINVKIKPGEFVYVVVPVVPENRLSSK